MKRCLYARYKIAEYVKRGPLLGIQYVNQNECAEYA